MYVASMLSCGATEVELRFLLPLVCPAAILFRGVGWEVVNYKDVPLVGELVQEM